MIATELFAMRLKDIAEKLNVSVSTVSRALREDTSRLVSPELRAQIHEMARLAKYVPHPAAQMMRKPKTNLITVLLPLETSVFLSSYYGAVLAGVMASSGEWDTETRIALLDPRRGEILEQMRQAAIGAGGLLFMAMPLSVRQVVKLEDFSRPLVVMGGSLPPHVDLADIRLTTVGVDNQSGAYEVTLSLLKSGHRQLALINGPPEARDAWEREVGFIKALKEFGLSYDPQSAVQGAFHYKTGVEGWERLKHAPVRPTAVVCGNDEIAFGLLEALRKDGLHCPEDVSVVGFDDSLWAGRVTPPLTTVRQPISQLGHLAVELLATRLQDPGDVPVEHRMFPPEVVLRHSTAAPHA
jgi:LacI family transcriptional regulator